MQPSITMISGLATTVLLLSGSAAQADTSSSFYLKKALVHRIQPAQKTQELPVIMVPGMNLSSWIYLTTPDGREGWARQFAEAGYEVFVINDPRFDFSRGFSAEGFEDVPEAGAGPANPDAEQGWDQDIWRRWGFGPFEGEAWPNARFPTDDFAVFEGNYPYLSRAEHSFAEAIVELLKMTEGAILLAHSAGGSQAVSSARANPELVGGLVLVEPTGPPTASDFPRLAGLSMLGVYGDYVESRRQSGRKTATEGTAELFAQNGGAGEVISLPEDHDIYGNSHLMMQGDNSSEIGEMILTWLAEHQGLTGEPAPDGPSGPRDPNSLFAQLDADENGTLSLEEFCTGRRMRRMDSDEVKDLFDSFDLNEDEQLSSAEYSPGGVGGSGGRRNGRG